MSLRHLLLSINNWWWCHRYNRRRQVQQSVGDGAKVQEMSPHRWKKSREGVTPKTCVCLQPNTGRETGKNKNGFHLNNTDLYYHSPGRVCKFAWQLVVVFPKTFLKHRGDHILKIREICTLNHSRLSMYYDNMWCFRPKCPTFDTFTEVMIHKKMYLWL